MAELVIPPSVARSLDEQAGARENCTVCLFFKKNHADARGVCRRYPPTPQVIGVDQHRGAIASGFYPPVSSLEWCGEYRPAKFDS